MTAAPIVTERALAAVRGARSGDGRGWRFPLRGTALRLAATCWLVYALHFATNTVRELYPALSLGDHGSFDVSEYLGWHDDIFAVPGRGAFINNNPGASILGAIPYALARPIIDRVVERVRRGRAASPEPVPEYRTIYPLAREFYRRAREQGLDVKFGLAAGVTQAFLMAPLSALSAVVMFRILVGVTASVQTALSLALLYAFATPVFYRTAQLNHNLLLSHCALFAFALLWRPWVRPPDRWRPRYLLAGLLCGWSMVLDYSGVVVATALGVYAVIRRAALSPQARSRWDLVAFGAGVLAGLAVLAGYQWAAFGHPAYPPQYYMPPAEFTGHGFRGMDWPQPDLLWETAFGMRFGLFTSAPLLLLALYVPGWFRRAPGILGTHERWWIVGFALLFFLFSAANQYGRMQFNTGVRHIVPVVPFVFLLAAEELLRMPRLVAVMTGVLATYWSWCLAMYRDVEQGLGVFESLIHVTLEGFRLPWLQTIESIGYVPAGVSALPLLVLSGALIAALWTVGAGGATGGRPVGIGTGERR